MSVLKTVKSLVAPNRVLPCRVLRGPFRGARFMANPQHSLRYIFGIYERELNGWIARAIPRTRVLLDVGANHGYFSFGLAAGWKRQGRGGTVVAFEPQEEAFQCLTSSLPLNARPDVRFVADQRFVGSAVGENVTTLDAAVDRLSASESTSPILIKIDVEGAEMDVLRGAEQLVRDGNLFLIEAHSLSLLNQVEQFFQARGHAVKVVHQRPLPLLGRECRDLENYWVVSRF